MLTTLILFVLIYSSVFSMGVYYINRLIEKGPQGASIQPEPDEDALPSRPMSAATEAAHEATEGGAS